MKSFGELLQALEHLSAKTLLDPNEKDLLVLTQEIMGAESAAVALLKEKLIGQMFVIIDGNKERPGIQAAALQCLAVVVRKTGLSDCHHFVKIYDFTCQLICDESRRALQKSLPEVLKEGVMLALADYVESLTEDALMNLFYDSSSASQFLSLGILLAVQIAKVEKSIAVRSSALDFLLKISQYEAHNIDLRDKVADTFVKVLPGIIVPLSGIIQEDTTNHSVIVLAQRCWGHFLLLTMRDIPFSEEPKSAAEILDALMSRSQNRTVDVTSTWHESLKKEERSRDWAKAAAGSLRHVIERIASKVTHPHRLVRLEMSIAFGRLLTECSDSLGETAGPLLDALVSLSQDEDEKIRQETESYLLNINEYVALHQLAQQRLPAVISQLNTSIRADDTGKVDRTLLMLHGYLEVFRNSKDGPCVIVNPLLLQKFLPALKTYCHVDLSADVLHQHELEPTDFKRYNTHQDQQWKGNLNPIFERICNAVAMHGFEDAAVLLMQDCENGIQPLESLRLLNLIVIHSKDMKTFMREHILQFYLDVNNSTVNLDPSAKEMATVLMRIALSMAGIACLATALEADFGQYLLQTLYPIVARLGSVFSFVRSAALEAAEVIARVCGTGDVASLIESNIDYLTHHIVLRLRKVSEEDVLDATRIVTRLCPTKTLHQLQFIVSQILTSSNDDFHSPHVGPYLRIFLAFVQCAEAAAPPPTSAEEKAAECENPCIIQLMELIQEDRQAGLEEEVDAETETPTEELEPAEEKPKPVPKFVDICMKTVKRCLHYLPMCTEMQKVICLEVLTIGLRVVAAESEDLLLPLVHQVWSPLVRRFHPTSKPLIISRSFSLLITLSNLSKSFVRSRTLKEVLPSLRDYLTRSAKTSYRQSTASAFSTTQGYKLQMELLTKLPDLVMDMQLQERDTSLVVEAAIPYLSQHQPLLLQERAVAMYLNLMKYDPYFVHFRLSALADKKEYAQNVRRIILCECME